MKRLVLALPAILVGMLAAAPVQAASCNGASHQPTLTAGAAAPGTGTTSTPITFSVRYTDSDGCAPDSVTVTISGVGTVAMTGSGTSYATGITYRATRILSAGSHAYSFAASSGMKSAALSAVSPARVVITAPVPPPTPKPTAKPTPPPPPPPTPPPPPPPPPTPALTVPPTQAPSAAPTPTPGATGTPSAVPTASGPASPSTGPSATPTATAEPSESPGIPPSAEPGSLPPPFVAPRGGGPLSGPNGTILLSVVMTAAGLTLFALLVRVQPVLSLPAVAFVETAAVAPAAEVQAFVAVGRDDDDDREPVRTDEKNVPRWLRPSVREARAGLTELRQRDWRS